MTAGRPVTREEKVFHDLLCRVVGCVACRFGHGVPNTYCSVHHIDGRTKPHAHWLVLPLCAGHHQDGTGAPGLLAIHPWKRRWEARYGTQRELLARAIELIVQAGHDVPATALEHAA